MVREQAEEKEVRKGMRLGKYELGRTLGEGNFGKVLASKTKINMVMELVTGGELFDKIVSNGKLTETEGRKMFQQLIDGISYCHIKGVFHRDLKVRVSHLENVLLDAKGHIKITDFGLSALPQHFREDGLLHTTCGSPNYVAPEVLANRGYEGAASDIWSCGVVLYVILTGCLPFDDRNLVVLYQKICKGDPPIPRWLSPGARTMIKKMLDPNPVTRITVAGIKASEWFKHEYIPSVPDDDDDEEDIDTDDDAFSVQEVGSEDGKGSDSPTIINAFQLIGMSSFLDLSGFFEQENVSERRIRFTSNSSAKDLLEKIENSVTEMGFSVQKKNAKLKVKQEEHNQKGQVGLSVTAEGELFPFISATRNNDVVDSTEFYREDEKKDERVGRIVTLLNAKQDWTEFVWEVEALPPTLELSDSEKDGENVEVEDVTDTHVEEPAIVARRGKRKLNDPSAEARKKELLCQRTAEHNSGISSGMKTFIEGLFTSAFNSFKEVVQNDIQERFEKVQKEMAELKQAVSQIPGPSDTVGKDSASEIPCPSATMGKSSQSLCPAATKEKGKGNVEESVVPPTVRRSPRQGRKITIK
ncbi:hypothetical protein HID58_067948 [Brassica napus]|uniref:non-specific serine/threonine protein kinase n=1 Tax=Brassica napus TaxID=3708 RepID=A0ABQ7ZK17_BRANA|nr:hypothetical protein HID58_067948 [Brassica napus]